MTCALGSGTLYLNGERVAAVTDVMVDFGAAAAGVANAITSAAVSIESLTGSFTADSMASFTARSYRELQWMSGAADQWAGRDWRRIKREHRRFVEGKR